jgi:hypothetical protein
MIIKAIHNATNQLEYIASAKLNHISHDFITEVERIISNDNEANFIINEEDIGYALKLFDYLFKHKLALFSYKCTTSLSFIENLQKILNDF